VPPGPTRSDLGRYVGSVHAQVKGVVKVHVAVAVYDHAYVNVNVDVDVNAAPCRSQTSSKTIVRRGPVLETPANWRHDLPGRSRTAAA